MPRPTCTLTAKDLTILEVMRDRCRADDPLLPILRRKLDGATVVFGQDVGGEIATLGSRVTYRIDDGEAHCRVLSHDRMASAVGMFLPIGTPRGLALLGLSEGDAFVIDVNGPAEIVTLCGVNYQPETARRQRERRDAMRPALRLIRGGLSPTPERPQALRTRDDDSGPGPEAA